MFLIATFVLHATTWPLTVTKDTVPTPPVLTDSLLLRWHLGLVHLYDTLSVHPDLQTLPGLDPLLKELDCRAWAGPSPNDTVLAKQRPGLASFPADQVAATIATTPPLTGAIRAGAMTPAEWTSATSAIEQEECARMALTPARVKVGHWPVDSTSTLGKNLAYFWTWEYSNGWTSERTFKHHLARIKRIRDWGLAVLNRKRLKSPAPPEYARYAREFGSRMEEWPTIKDWLIDANGHEIAIPNLNPSAVAPANNSVCTETQVSGTVTDTAHKIKAGLWVHYDLGPDRLQVKTDSTGSFRMTVDSIYGGLYVFADSATWRINHLMGWYDNSNLHVTNCVASPVNIVLKSYKDIMNGK